MASKQLSFQAPPALAIAQGDAGPNPGVPGAVAWSTSLAALVVWTGAQWTVPVGAGGGGPAVLQATLAVAGLAIGYAQVVVAHAGATPASKVGVWLVGALDAENDIEELADTNMRVFGVAEVGQIRFVLTGNGAFTGDFLINYQVTS